MKMKLRISDSPRRKTILSIDARALCRQLRGASTTRPAPPNCPPNPALKGDAGPAVKGNVTFSHLFTLFSPFTVFTLSTDIITNFNSAYLLALTPLRMPSMPRCES